MKKTGRAKYKYLLKVSADGKNTPLDALSMPCHLTGQPQARKPNIPSDPDYIDWIVDEVLCPPDGVTPPPDTNPNWVDTGNTGCSIYEHTYEPYSNESKWEDTGKTGCSIVETEYIPYGI